MQAYILWAILAGALLIAEIFTITFYFLALAGGAVAGGVMAYYGQDSTSQIIAAAIASLVSYAILYWIKPTSKAKLYDPDAGNRVEVKQWNNQESEVSYRGVTWTVKTEEKDPAPGSYLIVKNDNGVLQVKK